MKMKTVAAMVLSILATGTSAFAAPKNDCSALPGESALQAQLIQAATTGGDAGGLFHGTRMWAAVVNREGEICVIVTSTADPTQVWPGSQAIAKAKAYTANAFSIDSLALSTSMLYTFTQPGHSLWSLGQSNLWNPELTSGPNEGGVCLKFGYGREGGNRESRMLRREIDRHSPRKDTTTGTTKHGGREKR